MAENFDAQSAADKTPPEPASGARRFRVALSFAGAQGQLVKEVADVLAHV